MNHSQEDCLSEQYYVSGYSRHIAVSSAGKPLPLDTNNPPQKQTGRQGEPLKKYGGKSRSPYPKERALMGWTYQVTLLHTSVGVEC